MQPPPPHRSTNSNTWLIIIALSAMALVVLVGMGSYAAGSLKNVVSSDPQPIKGFGRPPIIRQLDEYWARYSLVDLGMQVDLPAEPIPSYPDWEFENRLATERWSFYVVRSGYLGADISAFQLRYGAKRTLDDAARDFVGMYKGFFTLVEKEKKRPMILKGKNAMFQRVVYEEEERTIVAEAVHYQDKEWIASLRFSFYKSDEKAVRKEIDRLLKSIEFTPGK